jgi:hypothetical protein
LYEAAATLVSQPGQTTSGHQANRETLQQFIGLKGLIEMAHC